MIGKHNSERQDALKEVNSNRMEVTEEKSQPMHMCVCVQFVKTRETISKVA